uniref:MD-2-related lipid-recognition domain-containing protein n=1 Tax=Anopheles coluzzii TaxID=1518534 RepID=A0A6E8WA22_ANOCL
MLRCLVVCFITISMFASKDAYQKSSKPVFFKRFECVGQPIPTVRLVKCNLDSPRHGPQVINIVANVEQPLQKLYVSTNIYVKNRQSLIIVYGTTFEYCEFLMRNESRSNNPVAVLIYNYAKHNFPQVLKPCPIVGCFNVSGLVVDKNLIPPFITPGGYFASQRFHNKRNETVFHYETEFSVATPSIFNKTMSLFTL